MPLPLKSSTTSFPLKPFMKQEKNLTKESFNTIYVYIQLGSGPFWNFNHLQRPEIVVFAGN